MNPFVMVLPDRMSRRPSCLVALSLIAFAAGCQGKDRAAGTGAGANMPLADGQFLTYAVTLDAPDASHQIVHLEDTYKYQIKALGNSQWQVDGSRGESSSSTGPGSSYTLDNNATITAQSQSEFSKWKVGRRFSDLWLAPNERQSGKVTHPLDDMGDFTVGPQEVWQRWAVVPAVSAGGDTKKTRYYEATTGWLVGSELERTSDGSKRVDVLRDTNVAIPTH